MNIQELNDILNLRRKEMKEFDLKQHFSRDISTCFNHYVNFLKENHLNHCDNSKEKFIIKMKEKMRTKDYYYLMHAIEFIDDSNKIKEYAKKNNIKKDYESLLNDYNKKILNDFCKSRLEYNKEITVKIKRLNLIKLMILCSENGIYDYSKFDIESIYKIKIKCLNYNSYHKRREYILIFRDFLKFLYEYNYLKINYSNRIENLKGSTKRIPDIWSIAETDRIVDFLPDNTSTEIRNKAMSLFTIRLGIRPIDVRNLKFENIDWKNNEIKFIQEKTKVYIKLPLPEEVGSAVIRYIKEARPITDLKYIFVTHNKKVTKLSSTFDLKDYLLKAYKLAGVDYLSKTNKGIYIFRHAVATNLLKYKVPLDIISSILGHLDNNSVKSYISLDDELLKECCLDLEDLYE